MSYAQLLINENFEYTVGTELKANGWVGTGTTPSTTNPILVSTSSISYTGYSNSGTGNEITLTNIGEDLNKSFTAQTIGTLYASVLANITSAQVTGDYFLHFNDSPTGTAYFGRIFVKLDGTKIAFGIQNSNNLGGVGDGPTYTTSTYDLNTTYLLVLKYNISTNTSSLIVNPSLSTSEPSANWISNSTGILTLPLTGLSTINIRQGSATNGPTLKLDGIRVGTSWNSIFSTGSVPTVPTGVINTTATSSSFTLAWTASTDAVGVTGYDVYKDNIFYGSTATTSLAITNLAANTPYSMTVKAKNAAGGVSTASTPLIVTTAKVESIPPSIPIGLLNTTPTTTAFTLLWTASTDNVAVTGYDIYKNGLLYGSTNSTSLAISNLAAETAYSMTVIAKDAAGNFSASSTPLIVTTGFPATYDISIEVGTNGLVKENNILLANATVITVNRNSTKTFTFTPSIGYEIATLTYAGVDVKSQISNNQFTTPLVISSATLEVTFQKIQCVLALKSAENGTMNLICYYGETPSFSFVPANGWKVNTVYYNNVDVTSSLVNGVYTLPTITANALLNVSFVSIATGAPELINNRVKVYSTNTEIIVDGTSEGETVTLYTVKGKQMQTVISKGEKLNLSVDRNTIYLVKTGEKTFKVII